jgi:putative hemolysin
MEFVELAIVVLMVMVNAIFASYEIALASVSPARLETLASEKKSGAIAALYMKSGIEKSLAVVQLGITLVGMIAGATGGASATDDLAPWLRSFGLSEVASSIVAIILVVTPLTAVTIIVGELMPKLFALRHKEWVCLTLSPVMRMFTLSVWPVVWLLEWSASSLMDFLEKLWQPSLSSSTKHEAAEIVEFKTALSVVRGARLIGVQEENIILRAARLAGRKVSEAMIPAQHIRMLDLSENLSTSLTSAHLDLHTRFPVCREANNPQTIEGYVNFKDIVTALKISQHDASLRGIMRDIPRIQATAPVTSALEFMLREHTHIALVQSNETIVGLLTLEDIVEELVGDIEDELDQLPVYIVRSGTGWIVGGGAKLTRVQELTGIEIDASSATLSSWMASQTEHVRGSEAIRRDGFRIIVRKVRMNRVLEAHVIAE